MLDEVIDEAGNALAADLLVIAKREMDRAIQLALEQQGTSDKATAM